MTPATSGTKEVSISVEEWLAIRKEAGTTIDPQTAEVMCRYGITTDPYGVYPDLSEEEQVFRAESNLSGFTPANLNPKLSGATLAKIMEGKLSSKEKAIIESTSAPASQNSSQSPPIQHQKKSLNGIPKKNNLYIDQY